MKMLSALWRLMRPHQWLKNSFVFTGLLFGHAWHDSAVVWHVVLVAVAFSLMASAIYILNDMVDREQDKLHPVKCCRPLAAGELTLSPQVLTELDAMAGSASAPKH